MIELRDYQLRACDTVDRRFADGRRGVVVVLPTGGGKTSLASETVRREIARGGRVLWLAPRVELCEQATVSLERAGLDVGMISAQSTRPARPEAGVQVASIQTLLARDAGGESLDPTLIVFDEAHMSAAAEWSTLLTRWPNARRLGLTATPARQDGVGLGGLFDCIVVGATIKQLTELGYLVPLEIIAPGRSLKPGQLAQSPVDAWRTHAAGEQAVLFAPNVKIANEMSAEFLSRGVSSAVVTGDMPATHRAEALAAYEAGVTRVLCSVGVLGVGWDSPRTAVAILARRCGSPSLYIQMAGRALRPFPGKTRALLLDLTGTCHIEGIGRPDTDRVYSLEGRGIQSEEAIPEGSFCNICGALLDGSTCIECGYERPAAKAPKVVNVPMRRLAAEFCAGDPPSVQIARLIKWAREAHEKGHKPGAALYRFKAVYHRWANAQELAAVRAALRGPS